MLTEEMNDNRKGDIVSTENSTMRLICLNLWRGKLGDKLRTFLTYQSQKTEIFCFQEVARTDYDNIGRLTYDNLRELLPDFKGYFRDYIAPGEYQKEGLAVFVKNTITVQDEGEIFVYNPPRLSLVNAGEHTLWRNLAYVRFNHRGKKILIANFHGLFDGPNKTDNHDRIRQARRIRKFLERFKDIKIVCGDFNLLPHSESLNMIGEGMRNLIREFNIRSTRSRLFKFENKFADYVLVSPDIQVRHFEVINETVSDHLPMLLEFE